jgi:hypothetical protein
LKHFKQDFKPSDFKIRGAKLAWFSKIPASTEIDQLQLTFFVSKIESGYFFLWNMIGIHT